MWRFILQGFSYYVCANVQMSQHYLAPSLHPGRSTTQDCDWFREIQTAQSFFFKPSCRIPMASGRSFPTLAQRKIGLAM